jgi:hypothetical protein
MEAADAAVLAALESSVLDPAIAEAALDTALDQLAAARLSTAPAAELKTDLSDLDAQLGGSRRPCGSAGAASRCSCARSKRSRAGATPSPPS